MPEPSTPQDITRLLGRLRSAVETVDAAAVLWVLVRLGSLAKTADPLRPDDQRSALWPALGLLRDRLLHDLPQVDKTELMDFAGDFEPQLRRWLKGSQSAAFNITALQDFTAALAIPAVRDDRFYAAALKRSTSALEAALPAEAWRLERDIPAQDAVCWHMAVIGEAARHLSPGWRAAHGRVDWETLAGLRNRLAHHGEALSPKTQWQTARQFLPALRMP